VTGDAHLVEHGDAVMTIVLSVWRDGSEKEEDLREFWHTGADTRQRVRGVVHHDGYGQLVEEPEGQRGSG
jgi:hypothetical protein